MWSDKDYETLLLKYEKALDDVERLRGENDNLIKIIETEKQIMTTLSQTESDLAAAVEVLRDIVSPDDKLSDDLLENYDRIGKKYNRARALLARMEVNP
jgi:flagellar biosynthesis/type III secretory pathway chaperone